MKQFLLLAATALLALAQAGQVKTVYVLPMSGGLEQYLAMHLTNGRVLQVVTDPQKADAVITDHIGKDLEQTLTELSAPPADINNPDAQYARPGVRAISRNRGTVFLIDRATHNILWSTFEEPSSYEPKQLNRTAEKIVERLAEAMKKD
jgi:hypothetical protein